MKREADTVEPPSTKEDVDASTELSGRAVSMLEPHSRETDPGMPHTVPQSVVVGELVGISGDGHTPLVVYRGQPGTAALFARTVLDLRAQHIGQQVVLVFQNGDLTKPIVMGVLRDAETLSLAPHAGQVDVDADGERLVVTAKEQLVLRCGMASITLTRAGKVLIQGSYVSSRSSGANRIRGGSVQLN